MNTNTQAPYGMSKAPTHVMADSLRQELRGFGIKVNVLIPGVVTTSITTKAIPSFQLKPDTFYESARESITQFVNNLLTPAGTSTEEFGRRFAGKLDRDRLGDYTLMGKQVNLLAFNYFMPRAFVDWVFGRVFGMDAVGQQERPKAA